MGLRVLRAFRAFGALGVLGALRVLEVLLGVLRRSLLGRGDVSFARCWRGLGLEMEASEVRVGRFRIWSLWLEANMKPMREFPKIRGTLFRGPYNKDLTI